jgi:hypothetical protein
LLVLAVLPVNASRWTYDKPIPNDLNLVGALATLQAVFAVTDAQAGYDLSNGLLLRYGR